MDKMTYAEYIAFRWEFFLTYVVPIIVVGLIVWIVVEVFDKKK